MSRDFLQSADLAASEAMEENESSLVPDGNGDPDLYNIAGEVYTRPSDKEETQDELDMDERLANPNPNPNPNDTDESWAGCESMSLEHMCRWNSPVTLSLHTDLAWACILVPMSEREQKCLLSFEGPLILQCHDSVVCMYCGLNT